MYIVCEGDSTTLALAARRIHPKRQDDEFIQRKTVRRLGQQIRAFADEQGLELQQIAMRMDVSKSHLSQVMKRGGTAAQIESIATALNISPWKFDMYHMLTFEDRVLAGDEVALLIALTLIESKKRARHDEVLTTLRKLVSE